MASKKGKILIVDDNLGIRQALKILLPMPRQIMRQHNGSIDLVKSDISETIFELSFR